MYSYKLGSNLMVGQFKNNFPPKYYLSTNHEAFVSASFVSQILLQNLTYKREDIESYIYEVFYYVVRKQ